MATSRHRPAGEHWTVRWQHPPLCAGGPRPAAHCRHCNTDAEADDFIAALREQCGDDVLIRVTRHTAWTPATQPTLPLDLPPMTRPLPD